MELTILMPCLNEAETLATCIEKAQSFITRYGLQAEILIADNGSTDGSLEIAQNKGARVIHVKEKGYGNALIAGIEAALGKYIIMGDADDSYDFSRLDAFVDSLRNGADLVMGNRFRGGIRKNAMPFLHRYLGNPVLSFIGRLFFNTSIGDFHCGLRGFSKQAAMAMNLQCTGMEFASEMVVKAALLKLKIKEVPTVLHQDGRSRPPHLRTWRDGWRHLRFLLMYSPAWLFLAPGLFFFVAGALLSIWLFFGQVYIPILNITLDVHTLVYSTSSVILGLQIIMFYIFSHTFGYRLGLAPVQNNFLTFCQKNWTLERGLLLAAFFLLLASFLTYRAISAWNAVHFGALAGPILLREVVMASTSGILGFQFLFYSFFYSILQIKNKLNDRST